MKAATVQSTTGEGEAQSWQATSLSGKKLKLKAKEVWLRFEKPDAQGLMDEASALSNEIDLQLLWDCAPEGEFAFTDIASEYFGGQASAAQQAALAIALQSAPVYFRRKQRGRFMRAPKEQLDAGIAALDRKQREQEQQGQWQAELVAGRFPESFILQAKQLLFNPDKNTLAYKAFLAACNETGESPPQLMMRCGALESPLAYHQGMFLKANFPNGAGHHADAMIADAVYDAAIAALPTAEVQAFSIDDATTTEIDDALSVTALLEGGHRIGVHISAPGLVISKDDSLDQVARARMSTVYMPGDKITMLPDAVIARFSLDAGSARPAVSIYVDVDAQGDLIDQSVQTRIELVPIAANLRLEHLEESVNQFADPEYVAKDNAFAFQNELLVLWRAAQKLHAKRQEQREKNGLRVEQLGVVDPNALQRDFQFQISQTNGVERVDIQARSRGSVLDTIVAEWMIYCNSTWGQWLADQGLPALFRTQKGWGPQRTRMQTTPAPHEGLGLEYYAWCTSPLRRYSDLVNQWQLIALAKHGVTAKMVAPFQPRDASLMGIAADFETCYQSYAEYQDRMEKYWCLRWLAQEPLPRTVYARHLKEGMSRIEDIPLHLPIPELALQPRMTRAEIAILETDLLQLSASVRVHQIEKSEPVPIESNVPETEQPAVDAAPLDDTPIS
ncbi:MAG: ribonuclease catalytic domain-containing protein [Polynucleobacter sp.]